MYKHLCQPSNLFTSLINMYSSNISTLLPNPLLNKTTSKMWLAALTSYLYHVPKMFSQSQLRLLTL